MLRAIIKALIPSKEDMFYTFFEEGRANTQTAAKNLLYTLMHIEEDSKQSILQGRDLKANANLVNKKTLELLNNIFITSMDRGDIQDLSGKLNKLTKLIIKIHSKLTIYNIDAQSDDCLIKNATTLLQITEKIGYCITALKLRDTNKILPTIEEIHELEENSIEDFKFAINEIYSNKFDSLMVIKLKEIYKNIDKAIELSVNVAELILQISIKNI
ncbi:MAG: hypothetical protein K0R14_2047 [Burkholderiales bacterium]|jgi:uncharacterized protein Yka (UPF0111/DUF47 family)|nr:hypothetical protein [Burkholderiales bacterium]